MDCFLTARQGKGADGFRSLLQKDDRTGIECRSGGKDIINEKEILICHIAILAQRKSIPQVLPAFGPVEGCLCAGVSSSQENITDRDTRTF